MKENRSADNVVVVIMDWTLAEGAKVTSFMQPKDVKVLA